jgi:hypothetical protein
VLRHPFNWKRASMAAGLCFGVGEELANLACEGLAGVIAAAWQGVERIRTSWQLPYGFLRHAGLTVA